MLHRKGMCISFCYFAASTQILPGVRRRVTMNSRVVCIPPGHFTKPVGMWVAPEVILENGS